MDFHLRCHTSSTLLSAGTISLKKNKSANIAYVLCRKMSDLLADEVNINVSRMCQGWDSCCSSKSGYEIKLWLLYEYFIAE